MLVPDLGDIFGGGAERGESEDGDNRVEEPATAVRHRPPQMHEHPSGEYEHRRRPQPPHDG
jgi:hypothetical protein